MRWEALFADLEAEVDAEAETERRSEIADRIRSEFGRLRLIDRLQPLLGREEVSVRMGLLVGDVVAGSVLSLGADWVLLSQQGASECLVPLGGVQWVAGLGPVSAEPGWEGRVGARLGLRLALRRIVRDRSAVAISLLSGQIQHGRIARVAADHIVLEAMEAGRRTAETITIPLTAIALLRRS
jgi:hypothetical protein